MSQLISGRRFAVLAAAGAAIVILGVAPGAWATYPGRNGTVAYQEDDNNPDSGMTEFSGIRSIPQGSAANCADTSPAGDQGAPCSIGRLGYSPDGTRIVADRSGRLEVLDANGANVKIVPALTSQDHDPAFLRDGNTIAFDGKAKGATNLYTVSADGTGLRQLTTKGGFWPAPCANGSIAFINNQALYVMRANGSGLRRLARRASSPDCAPNSKSIIYEGAMADYIVNTRGGTRQFKGGDGGFPVFSPDGAPIASVQDLPSDEVGGYSVPTVVVERTSGRQVRKVAFGNNLNTAIFGPVAWRPTRAR